MQAGRLACRRRLRLFCVCAYMPARLPLPLLLLPLPLPPPLLQVVHGTDTMAYTACALSLMLQGFRKPIILTGGREGGRERGREGGKEGGKLQECVCVCGGGQRGARAVRT